MQCSERITWDGGVHVSLICWQLIGWLLLWSAVIGYCPTYTLIPGKVVIFVLITMVTVKVNNVMAKVETFLTLLPVFTVFTDLRFSCSICCMELDLWRVCGAGGAVGRCHVVVLFTWST